MLSEKPSTSDRQLLNCCRSLPIVASISVCQLLDCIDRCQLLSDCQSKRLPVRRKGGRADRQKGHRKGTEKEPTPVKTAGEWFGASPFNPAWSFALQTLTVWSFALQTSLGLCPSSTASYQNPTGTRTPHTPNPRNNSKTPGIKSSLRL